MKKAWPLLLLLIISCRQPNRQDVQNGNSLYSCRQVGEITSNKISEVSGIARSNRDPNIFWSLNDSGNEPCLYAIAEDGEIAAAVKVTDAENFDWEDLASFVYHDRPYLLIADAGNNTEYREQFVLYIVKEPMPDDQSVAIAWTIRFVYEDGARDCEAAAVDVAAEKILLLSKRDVPAVLYELSLVPSPSQPQIAVKRGPVDTILQPTADEIHTSLDRFHAQPTGMDISADGSAIAVLTYRRLYIYQHAASDSWLSTLRGKPVIVEFPVLHQAEAVCFSQDSSVRITSEGTPAPIMEIDFN
ncbi:MAG: hypothetical protein EHM72_10605 [Calditrichaeota bacterium]|nr:MAG: hypothetical protein EHM72_10605 [Calditrichota bacterium]